MHVGTATSSETIPPVPTETSGGVLSAVDMVVQRRDGPRRLRDNDDVDDGVSYCLVSYILQGGPKKWGHRLMSTLNQF